MEASDARTDGPGQSQRTQSTSRKTGQSTQVAALPEADDLSETGVLLDALIHDLRTPLSAMSGWLEVLEAHFGTVDGLVGRALVGLRRGVEGQTQTLNGISDVLTKQRLELPEPEEGNLLERLRHTISEMDGRPDAPLGATELARLAPLREFSGRSGLACPGAGAAFGDACGILLHAVAVAQGEGDEPIAIVADDAHIRIRVPGASGDLSSLESLAGGLRPHAPKRPHIRPQALWLARSIFRRCNLRLRLVPGVPGGVDLLIGREGSLSSAVGR